MNVLKIEWFTKYSWICIIVFTLLRLYKQTICIYRHPWKSYVFVDRNGLKWSGLACLDRIAALLYHFLFLLLPVSS